MKDGTRVVNRHTDECGTIDSNNLVWYDGSTVPLEKIGINNWFNEIDEDEYQRLVTYNLYRDKCNSEYRTLTRLYYF